MIGLFSELYIRVKGDVVVNVIFNSTQLAGKLDGLVVCKLTAHPTHVVLMYMLIPVNLMHNFQLFDESLIIDR